MSKSRTPKMPVMEVFGPTIQGEGMVIGRKTMFVRTGGCDYSCSWCDSAFTWNGEQKADMLTADEVWNALVLKAGITSSGKLNFNHVTISGGNPALIGAAMNAFIDICSDHGVEVGLETQGTRWQGWFTKVTDLTISPKPPSSGMVTDFDKLDNIIQMLEDAKARGIMEGNYTLKVVIFDEADFQYAKQIYERYCPEVFYVSVGNEDSTTDENIADRLLIKLEQLWNMVLDDPDCNDWRPLPQLHTLVWNNKRGV